MPDFSTIPQSSVHVFNTASTEVYGCQRVLGSVVIFPKTLRQHWFYSIYLYVWSANDPNVLSLNLLLKSYVTLCKIQALKSCEIRVVVTFRTHQGRAAQFCVFLCFSFFLYFLLSASALWREWRHHCRLTLCISFLYALTHTHMYSPYILLWLCLFL